LSTLDFRRTRERNGETVDSMQQHTTLKPDDDMMIHVPMLLDIRSTIVTSLSVYGQPIYLQRVILP
jgi:hypothetical protein